MTQVECMERNKLNARRSKIAKWTSTTTTTTGSNHCPLVLLEDNGYRAGEGDGGGRWNKTDYLKAALLIKRLGKGWLAIRVFNPIGWQRGVIVVCVHTQVCIYVCVCVYGEGARKGASRCAQFADWRLTVSCSAEIHRGAKCVLNLRRWVLPNTNAIIRMYGVSKSPIAYLRDVPASVEWSWWCVVTICRISNVISVWCDLYVVDKTHRIYTCIASMCDCVCRLFCF